MRVPGRPLAGPARLFICGVVLLASLGGAVGNPLPVGAQLSVAGLEPDTPAGGYKFGSVLAVAERRVATSFRVYTSGRARPQSFVPVVYRVANGAPTTLVAHGPAFTVEANRAKDWVDAPLPRTELDAGSYLVGVISGHGGTASVYYSRGGTSFWNENAFPQPAATWGRVNPDNVTWAFELGWEVASTTTTTTPATTIPTSGDSGGGCPAFPAFPDKVCTGVPAGTALTDYRAGDVVTDNAVISGVRITKRVTVRANNVTFRDCLIHPTEAIFIAVDRGFNGLTIENCTIKAGGLIAPFSGLTLRRVLVDQDPGAYRPDGIVVGYSSIGNSGENILIEDSYISGQWGEGGSDPDHPDGIQFWGFGTVSNVTIRHNYIDSANLNPDPTAVRVGACAFLADGSYRNVTFEYNYCVKSAGRGGYFHLRLASDQPTSGHVIRGNRFANRGSTSPVDLFRATPAVWSDNRYADNGELIPQPAVRN